MNTNYLSYYDIFEDEKALWFHVKAFFSKHNDLESLSQEIYRKFGFLHPKEGSLLFNHYTLLKDDLPDGQDFEDFLEEFKDLERLMNKGINYFDAKRMLIKTMEQIKATDIRYNYDNHKKHCGKCGTPATRYF